jgi:hypothetical protein
MPTLRLFVRFRRGAKRRRLKPRPRRRRQSNTNEFVSVISVRRPSCRWRGPRLATAPTATPIGAGALMKSRRGFVDENKGCAHWHHFPVKSGCLNRATSSLRAQLIKVSNTSLTRTAHLLGSNLTGALSSHTVGLCCPDDSAIRLGWGTSRRLASPSVEARKDRVQSPVLCDRLHSTQPFRLRSASTNRRRYQHPGTIRSAD